jgi:hypothetical protein
MPRRSARCREAAVWLAGDFRDQLVVAIAVPDFGTD